MPGLNNYFNYADQVIPLTAQFSKSDGTGTIPDTVVLSVTDPTGSTSTYIYAAGGVDPNVIVSDGTGAFHIWLQPFNTDPDPAPPAGLWSYNWTGVGGMVDKGAQVIAGSFRVFDTSGAAGRDRTYVSVEELKSSNNDSSGQVKDDFEYQRACITATTLIHDLCGQHFFQLTEPRTYSYESIYELFIDPVVPGSITEFALDYDGDGDYETIWTEGKDFQTLRYNEKYNQRWLGEARPHDFVRVLMGGTASPGGQMLPFVWAYTPNNRVKITATWGWPEIPQNISHAALLLATDLFKMKDAPWGIAGMGELGMVKTQANPEVMELLSKYREPRNLVGV